MSRQTTPFLLAALLATLIGFGLLADRALVGQVRSAGEAAEARAGEAAVHAARAVRASIAHLEQQVAAGRPPAGVATESIALPPPVLFPSGPGIPYARRSRGELSRLLSSNDVTPSGLPEAVVARLALGETAPVSGAARGPRVEERLLNGELPVRPGDLRPLAAALGIHDDPRVARLEERLRRVPDRRDVPALPSFRRRRVGDRIEGWTYRAPLALRYEVSTDDLLKDAGAAGRVEVAAAETRAAMAPATRLVPVPDVEGLEITVAPERPATSRITALRLLLLACLLAGTLGLVAARRAFDREARAVARERAFLASVTHELRTPLAAIRLFGERLAQGRGDARDYGGLVAQESERLDRLVEGVLAATRADEAPRFGPVSPAELLRSAVDLIAARAERRHVKVDCRADDPLPEARWDAESVRRALLNLIDNAVKHGREGGRVEVSASGTDGHVRLSVSDDGPGIGRAHRDRIFERFGRGATDAPGTGLGLYLVEQVARAHGGRVDLVTEEARGATFTLVLPVLPPGARA